VSAVWRFRPSPPLRVDARKMEICRQNITQCRHPVSVRRLRSSCLQHVRLFAARAERCELLAVWAAAKLAGSLNLEKPKQRDTQTPSCKHQTGPGPPCCLAC
jgi:hypothetical protein